MAALLAAACTRAQVSSGVEASDSSQPGIAVATITKNTQGTYDDVRIGAGNFREEAYTDERGQSARGFTAGLWISVRDDASQDRAIRVHRRQRFVAGNKSFEVRAVREREVELAIGPKS